MCEFFSVVSDGEGKVSFFKPEDVVSIMAKGNPDGLDFNSHTSLMSWLGIKGKKEDVMNKWEYNPEDKKLTVDNLGTDSDEKLVQFELDEFFKEKDIVYLRNLYGRNTGHWNTGDRNTGHWNTGDRNTGHWNTGDWNTGDRNTGHWNTGDWNTGHSNTGDSNTGHWNTGGRSGGFFCTTPDVPRLFNKPCSQEAAKKAEEFPLYINFTEWIYSDDMTKVEKEANEGWKTLGGYLKFRSYQEAWEIVAKKEPKKIKEIQTWENFDAKIFQEITGLKV